MPEFSKAELSAIKAVTRHFSAKLQSGDACPPVAYVTVGRRRVALDVAVIVGHRPSQERVAKARLREDVVARRVLRDIEAALRAHVPDGKAIILTLGAPIKVPSQLVSSLTNVLLNYLKSGADEIEEKKTVLGNRIRFRVLRDGSMWNTKVIAFVFSGDPEPGILANAMHSMLDEISARANTPTPEGFSGERWLILANERWIADPKTYRWAFSRATSSRGFKRILMLFKSGRVEDLRAS